MEKHKEKMKIESAQSIGKDETKEKKKKDFKMTTQKIFIFFVWAVFLLTAMYFIFTKDALKSFFLFSGSVLVFCIYLVIRKKLLYYNRIKKMELAFPDFISLMASNLRAGMTIDRALVLSARKEFDPLDKEILQVGKDMGS